MPKFIYIVLSLFFILVLGNKCTTSQKTVNSESKQGSNLNTINHNTNEAINYSSTIQYIPDSLSEITINLVGDLMCHLPQTNNAKLPNGEYDFNPSFEYIKPYLQDADITIGNLETTFAGTTQPYAGYPAFNSPDAYCKAIKEAGFDFLVTANNHSMDTREDGLLRTIDVIKKNGLGYAGTYLNQRS